MVIPLLMHMPYLRDWHVMTFFSCGADGYNVMETKKAARRQLLMEKESDQPTMARTSSIFKIKYSSFPSFTDTPANLS